jgi:hypothetical protein
MSAFEMVKFLHILFAIIAVGFNASYGGIRFIATL